jgi:hypothetical protein
MRVLLDDGADMLMICAESSRRYQTIHTTFVRSPPIILMPYTLSGYPSCTMHHQSGSRVFITRWLTRTFQLPFPPISPPPKEKPAAADVQVMSDNSQVPWSVDPNAPLIPYSLYQAEKYNFAGVLITAMFYGGLTHASVCPHLFDLPCSRDRHRSVLSMHERVA